MADERVLRPYPVNVEAIAAQSADPTPRIVFTDEEYQDLLSQYRLRPGTKLSDVGILRAMEAGLIKIWDEEGGFDLNKQIQSQSIDLHLGHNFFWPNAAAEDGIRIGEHTEILKRKGRLGYAYLPTGVTFSFKSNNAQVALSHTQEHVSLSNCVVMGFDGKSTLARLGLSVHQTAGTIEPGFVGQITVELSNANSTNLREGPGGGIGSGTFTLLDQPSTRPRHLDTRGGSVSNIPEGQYTPYRFWKSEWDQERMVGMYQQLEALQEMGRPQNIIDRFKRRIEFYSRTGTPDNGQGLTYARSTVV